MRTDLFDYHLPRELIATAPAQKRDDSRLLCIDRATGAMLHRQFRDIGEFLRPGDLLVLNDSRVIPARMHGKRLSTGGTVEFLLLERRRSTPETDVWVVLCRPARKLKPGEEVYFAGKQLGARVLHYVSEGEREVEFNVPDVLPWLDQLGEIPLPPYIMQRRRELSEQGVMVDASHDAERYQTVYARDPGSVAAPTAGLHFTPELLESVRQGGVEIARVTLHVGPGTFRPVEVDDVEQHKMHEERFTISAEAANAITRARQENRRIVAVGTTSVRVLESAADESGNLSAGDGETRLMIVPGYRFKLVQAMITNFHLPKSTLLMLVSAFAGRELVLRAYEEAISRQYRFYSYGDAMLIS